MTVAFSVVPGNFAVARLDPSAPQPEWAGPAPFCCVTRTAEELSVVCAESSVPEGVRMERGWALLKLAGPFSFGLVGILVAVLEPLAKAGVSVFAISTFDTDYVLVKRDRLKAALAALAAAGYEKRD